MFSLTAFIHYNSLYLPHIFFSLSQSHLGASLCLNKNSAIGLGGNGKLAAVYQKYLSWGFHIVSQ